MGLIQQPEEDERAVPLIPARSFLEHSDSC